MSVVIRVDQQVYELVKQERDRLGGTTTMSQALESLMRRRLVKS